MTPNIADIIRQHVSLEVRCIDRLYLHAWMPKLQTSGGLCYFLQEHLRHPIPSPALFKPLHDRFVSAVQGFAQRHRIPLIPFESKQRKDDVVAEYRRRFTGQGGGRRHRRGAGEDALVQGPETRRARQEGQASTSPASRSPSTTTTSTSRTAEWGPAFLKIGTYLPYPVKLCLNGHEWVKQQLRRQRMRFERLDNGFLAAPIPPRCRPSAMRSRHRCAGLLRSLVSSPALADDRHRPRRRLRPPPRDLPARSEPHPGLRPPGARAPLLRGRHPREPRSRAARPRRLLFPLRLTRATPAARPRLRTRVITTACSRACISNTRPPTSSNTSKSNARCAPKRRSTTRRIST